MGKTKNVNVTDKVMEQEKPKRYQWIKGDNFGDIVTVSHDDSEFIYFTNGEQIYKTIVREFLQEIVNDEIPLPDFKGPEVPKRVEAIQQINSQSPQSQQESPSKQEYSPLDELIVKLSQKNIKTINIPIGINIPRKEIVDMLIENSDESREEILKSIAKLATSRIVIYKLSDFIEEEIIKYLDNYYNLNSKYLDNYYNLNSKNDE